ncbi:MAG TPA: hypothetical protein VGI54_05510 [Solirubrobacteraceae bacterium]
MSEPTVEALEREWAAEDRAEWRLFLRGAAIALLVTVVVILRVVLG